MQTIPIFKSCESLNQRVLYLPLFCDGFVLCYNKFVDNTEKATQGLIRSVSAEA